MPSPDPNSGQEQRLQQQLRADKEMPPGYAPGPTPADADWHGESWLPAATPTQDTHAAKYAAEVAGGASADEDLVAVSDLLAALEEVVDGLSRHG